MNSAVPYFLESTPSERLAMRLSIGANALVMAFCAGYLVLQYNASAISWVYIAVALLVGYFVADFASGLVHWGLDTWFDERQLGRVVAIAREHHTHPQHILGYGFMEHCTLGSAPSAILVGLPALVTALCPTSIPAYCLMIVWLVTSTCLFFGTSFHNLSHRRSKSAIIRAAQKMHLVVAPEHHWVHHRSDQIIRYCVINGWANYVCDPLGVWRGLEWLIQKLTGAVPRRDDLEWQRLYKETGTLISPALAGEKCGFPATSS
ncbi:MAG: hypothetical protein QOD09_4290 [Bradyrhizobium sp.]|jgi:ubiquitin-conjugating enzyme E2 variant|nr:hypothetical protein [Bradyrhizobium sp.]